MSDTLPSEASSTGRVVGGRYRILCEIGSGGMGTVYAAEDTVAKRRVALKMLRSEIRPTSELVRRFVLEAKVTAQIKHPNIVQVFESGCDASTGSFFFVMELLQGEDLKTRLGREGPMAPKPSMDVLIPIAEALVAAHAVGIIHRDLKPENLFLADTLDGMRPKIIDFGISKCLDPKFAEQLRTRTGTVMGTTEYMSPEQAGGETVDGRSDVWSLGVVLYEMLSGRLPFEAANPRARFKRLLMEEPTPLGDMAPHLPASLVEVVQGGLQRNLDQRIATVADFLEALRACKAGLDAGTDTMGTRRGPVGPPRILSRPRAAMRLAPPVVAVSLAMVGFAAVGIHRADGSGSRLHVDRRPVTRFAPPQVPQVDVPSPVPSPPATPWPSNGPSKENAAHIGTAVIRQSPAHPTHRPPERPVPPLGMPAVAIAPPPLTPPDRTPEIAHGPHGAPITSE